MWKLLYLAALIIGIHALCSFNQECKQSPYDCDTPYKLETPVEPQLYQWTQKAACPEFEGKETCCNDAQNSAMLFKYNLIDATFGSSAGGCDACAQNMKRLWCYFTCYPNQADVVEPTIQKVVQDPTNPSVMVNVLLLNFNITEDLACSLYESCKKCPYTTQVSAMQSAHGFAQFQGFNAISYGKTWITFKFFNSTDHALDLEMEKCNANKTSIWGYDSVPCSCNNCEKSCAANFDISDPDLLDGLDWVIVGITYLCILVFTAILFFGRWAYERKKKRRQAEENRAPLRDAREMESAS